MAVSFHLVYWTKLNPLLILSDPYSRPKMRSEISGVPYPCCNHKCTCCKMKRRILLDVGWSPSAVLHEVKCPTDCTRLLLKCQRRQVYANDRNG